MCRPARNASMVLSSTKQCCCLRVCLAPWQVGRRLTKVSMLSGSIVRVWGALEAVLARSESILSRSDRTMRIVRVNTGDATSLVGEYSGKPVPPSANSIMPNLSTKPQRCINTSLGSCQHLTFIV